ncbi:MAG: flagellar basal-body rod protein FlgF [Pseudomonadota bacterium]
MESGLYVALSAQLALQQRLDTVANNVANSATPGYRAEHVDFDTVLSEKGSESVAFVSDGTSTFSPQPGAAKRTGNPLDAAIHGQGFFAIQTPGGTVYTRDGRMQISATGELQSTTGHPILDVGGAPIRVNANLGPIEITRGGKITQNGNAVASLGLFSLPKEAELTRYGTSGFTSTVPGEPVVDFTSNGVVQGYVEGSNVNPVSEMTRLIAISRTFEAISASIDQRDGTFREAIRVLSGGN